MDLIWALVLGVLQGLTEFLPVSSSGHLVIAQSLIPNFSQPGVLFDTFLHAGTTLSVIVYFRKTLRSISGRYLLLLALATIPAGLVGIIFQSTLESLFMSTKIVGVALIITAAVNFATDKTKGQRKPVGTRSALLIGVAQALAIIPGISRSGSTIFTGSSVGLKKEDAAKFSFLLSIPAIVGANVLEFMTHASIDNFEFVSYVFGFAAAFLSGYFAIKTVLKFLTARKFKYFALYCLIVGLVVLLL
jgi:undecaprenyl-diphosphatase